MSVLEITNQNFEEKVLGETKPVLIDFWAAWCGPCKMMSPIVDEIAEELGERAVVGKVNVDEEGELAAQFGIMSIPTLIIFKEGKPVKTFVGVQDKEIIISAMN